VAQQKYQFDVSAINSQYLKLDIDADLFSIIVAVIPAGIGSDVDMRHQSIVAVVVAAVNI